MDQKRVLIIGGGIAGLCAGVYLCKNGFEEDLPRSPPAVEPQIGPLLFGFDRTAPARADSAATGVSESDRLSGRGQAPNLLIRYVSPICPRIITVRDELRDFEGMVPQRDHPLFYFSGDFFFRMLQALSDLGAAVQ